MTQPMKSASEPSKRSMKTLTAKQLLGGQGINLIERLVAEMGFV